MRTGAGGRVRPPVAAGTFYPATNDALADVVDDLLAAAEPSELLPEAVIVPHAGYAYSGPIAATAYASLGPVAALIERVVLFGPAHFAMLRGMAVPDAGSWDTPLGAMPIDPQLRETAVGAGAVVDDLPHAPEHSLEVQLPFLQRILRRGTTVLPVAVGTSDPGGVADVMEALWGGSETLVVISTDLSHYHDDETAKRLDRRTADAILARDPGALGPEDACGVHALRGMVELARRRDLEVRLLDLRTSADTAGDPWRVVGYGAFGLRARERTPP